MRRRWIVLLVIGLVGGFTPSTVGAALPAGCDAPAAPPLSFGDRVYVDRNRAGGEPVTVVGQDGSISFSAHAGTTHVYKEAGAVPGAGDFAAGYANQTLNWRSDDGGDTWSYVGTAGLPAGPHSATSSGFSDPDYTMDAAGRIYNTEINLANVAVFSSDDDGQSYNLANPVAASGDRPWVTAAEANEVYLYVNTFKQLWRSTNGGITFDLVTLSVPVDGKLLVDPRNPDDGLIGPMGGFFRAPLTGVAISDDDGETWTQHPDPGLTAGQQFFGVMAVDKAGHVYAASAGGYTGPGDTTSDGFVEFTYFDRDTEEWAEPVRIPTPGDALWPWVVAGDDGRAAVAWLQTTPEKPNEFHVYAAVTHNARGSLVQCADGTMHHAPAVFSVADASKTPIHVGAICVAGTNCNLSTGDPGDRRLGDFITANYDKDGNLFIASGDTRLTNPLGGKKPVANPIFIKAEPGAELIAEPMEVRESRCLLNLPTC
jgi:hypothetical protein